MAISSGVRDHRAILEAAGGRWDILDGSATLAATMMSSMFTVRIPMGLNNAENAFANLSDLDAKVIIRGDDEDTLLTGMLDNGEFDYERRLIIITGRCTSAPLHEKKTSDKWTNKKPDEVIKDLAEKAGLSTNITATSETRAGRKWGDDFVKLSDNVSYASVIHKMTEVMGARWWVDNMGVLQVRDESDSSGTYTITYRDNNGAISSDALGIRIFENFMLNKNLNVTVKSWNQKEKKVISSEKKSSGQGGDLKYEYYVGGLNQEQADQYAESKAKEHLSHQIRLEADCVGDVQCQAGMKLQLIGTSFAQSLNIDAVEHAFGRGGHRMMIVARSARDGRGIE